MCAFMGAFEVAFDGAEDGADGTLGGGIAMSRAIDPPPPSRTASFSARQFPAGMSW